MLGYKGLNSCHRQSVCMALLKLSKQFIRVRRMTYLERLKFPLEKDATNHVTINPSEMSCNFGAHFDSVTGWFEYHLRL